MGTNVAPLPPGFTLDTVAPPKMGNIPAPPPGFTLDTVTPPQNTDVMGGFMQRRPDGQLVIPKNNRIEPDLGGMSLPEYLGRGIVNTGEDVARALTGGFRNILAAGVTLPDDIAQALGDEPSQSIDSFTKNLPIVEQNNWAGDVGQTITQYATPAVGAAGLVPSAAKNAPTVAKVASGALKTVAASLADMLVTDPNQASTLGDMIGMGPTEIDPGDSNLMKRVKVGAETPIAEGVMSLVKGTGKAIKGVWDVNKARVDPAVQKQIAEKLVMQSASDPAKAAADIAATRAMVDPNGAFKPTGPESSKDIGLLQLQRGVAQDPRMVARQQSNAEATVNTFGEATQLTSPNKTNAGNLKKAVKDMGERVVYPAQQDLAQAEQRGAQIAQKIQTQAEELAAQKAAGPSASAQIAEADQAARQKVTQTKNELYDTSRVDPEGKLVADSADFLTKTDNIKEKPGAVDSGLPANIKVELERIRPQSPDAPPVDIIDGETGRVLNLKEPTTMSFEYLSNLRSSISEAISTARAAGKGARVDTLMQLNNEVNAQIDNFASSADPAAREAAGRLAEANQYYKDTASPILREGTGGKLTRAEQAGQPVAPTEVGRAYLGKGPAARERVADFNRMLAQVDNPKDVETAARDWLVSDLARTVDGKLTPERIQKWMENKDVAEILNGRPDVKKEVGQMLNRIRAKSGVQKKIEQEILDKTAAVKKKQNKVNESALGAFLDTRDPYAEVGRVLNGEGPVRQDMRKLRFAASQDSTGEAMNGLKDAVKTWMRKKVLTSKAATGRTLESGAKKPSFGELDEIINTMNDNNVRGVLEDLYGANSPELRNLDKVRNQLEIMSRQERVQGSTGSSTKPIEENTKRTTTTLAAIAAQNFRQNRMLNIMASWLPDQSQQAIKDFMIEMILDPRMSETLMLKQNEANMARIEKELRTYVTNNVLGSGEDRRQDNQKDDTMPPKGENK